jgi:hypothetical protein
MSTTTLKDNRKQKGLQSQLNAMIVDLELMKQDMSRRSKEINIKQNQVIELKEKIRALNNKTGTLKITEHALLRYLERVKGIDLQQIENEIINQSLNDMVATLGDSGTFPHPNGYKIVVKDSTIVTIL